MVVQYRGFVEKYKQYIRMIKAESLSGQDFPLLRSPPTPPGIPIGTAAVRRDLRALNYVTSYTHRGQFITLPKIPCFDNNGIWFFHEIGFSQYGNSLESILKLIDKSKQGVSREELEDILKIGISKQIQILIGQEKLHRVKLGSKYLYLPEEVMKNKKKKYRLLGSRQTEDYFEKNVRIKDLIALLRLFQSIIKSK